MGLRDNFKQAAKELMDGPDTSRSQTPASAQVPESVPEVTTEETGDMSFQDIGPDLDGTESFGGGHGPTPSPEIDRFTEATTVIAAGTVIRGSIESNCNVELYGEIQGDIITTKDLKLKGRIRGNATGGNVALHSIHMVGNITASGRTTLDAGSEVEGDVTAESVILNGKVQGNVQVAKRLSLESEAVICGRVSADKLSVEEGAIIQGEILIGKNLMSSKSGENKKEH